MIPSHDLNHPASLFVARVLGITTLVEGQASYDGHHSLIRTSVGDFKVDPEYSGPVTVLIRPDAAFLRSNGAIQTVGRVTGVSFRGSLTRVVVTSNNEALVFEFPSYTPLPEKGQPITLHIDPEQALEIYQP
jgi:ABC-type Fe3+/spermidine/putrescine transport system ATPase subunit